MFHRPTITIPSKGNGLKKMQSQDNINTQPALSKLKQKWKIEFSNELHKTHTQGKSIKFYQVSGDLAPRK
jgi:hypothetical protein